MKLKRKTTLILQTGSRYLHINVEVRPSPTKPQPLEKRDNTFSLDVLPDNSKMVTARLSYQSPGYERSKPQLNQIYVDTVHLLQLHTNFNQLSHTTDYLRALARCLEAGYFGLHRIDHDALTLMRSLARQLQYVHRYSSEPQKPNIRSSESQPLPHSAAESLGDLERPYASAKDFAESLPQGEQSFTSTPVVGEEAQGRGDQGSPYANVKFVPPEEGKLGYMGRGDGEGRVKDAAEHPAGHQRNAFSIRVSADADGEEITVQISDDEDSVSQSKTFSIRDSQPQDSGSAKSQPHTSVVGVGQSSISSDSQSGSSGLSDSQSDSSSMPPARQSDTSQSSERELSRTASSPTEKKAGSTQGDSRDQWAGNQATPIPVEPPHRDSEANPQPRGVELLEGSERRTKDQHTTARNEDTSSTTRSREHRPDDEL